MNPKKIFWEAQANTIIKNLEKRNMKGYYCDSKKSALEQAMSLVEDGAIVSFGGSMTLGEIGLYNALDERTLTVLDRGKASSIAEIEAIYRATFSADNYFMSTNAITLDGELINVDGGGNRVAALIYGPRKVIIIAGMNKVVVNEAAGIERVRNFAAPANTIRLNKKTPCVTTGKCHNCLSDDCICCQTVITRYSRFPDRIHVILVGDELGY